MSTHGDAPGVRRSRNAIDAEVQVTQGSKQSRVRILDVSLTGLRAAQPEELAIEPGEAVELRFPLDAEVPLVMHATVVRSDAGQLAFRFGRTDDATEQALRALIHHRGTLHDSYGA